MRAYSPSTMSFEQGKKSGFSSLKNPGDFLSKSLGVQGGWFTVGGKRVCFGYQALSLQMVFRQRQARGQLGGTAKVKVQKPIPLSWWYSRARQAELLGI